MQLLKLIEATLPINPKEPYEYYHIEGMDVAPIQAQQKAHKEMVAREVEAFARQYEAQDAACVWSPMSGMTILGLIYAEKPTSEQLAKFGLRKPEINKTYTPSVPVWKAQPNRSTTEGKQLFLAMSDLSLKFGEKIELSDFILDELGLFKQFGAFKLDGGFKQVPVRVWVLQSGVYIRCTQVRNYEIPENAKRITQTYFVAAQEIDALTGL